MNAVEYYGLLIDEGSASFNKPLPKNLTPAELRVVQTLVIHDYTINQAADKLCISPVTAHQHISAVRKAVGVKTNIQLVLACVENGWVKRK